jgi:hypothetical protein
MAEDANREVQALLKLLDRLDAQTAAVRKRAQQVSSDTEKLIKEVQGYKDSSGYAGGAGWAKQAKKLGGDATVEKALLAAETKNTRGAVEAALKLVEKNKALEPVTRQIKTLLKADDDGGKILQAVMAKAGQFEGEIKAIEAEAKSLTVTKL